jgi:manganese/zinc/iron transport system permease protein
LNDRRFRAKIAEQKLLRILYELHEAGGGQRTAFLFDDIVGSTVAPRSAVAAVTKRLQRSGDIAFTDETTFSLTTAGLKRAGAVARAHRLWEVYLTEHAESAGNFADLDSESLDDLLPRELIRELEDRLRNTGRLPAAINGE